MSLSTLDMGAGYLGVIVNQDARGSLLPQSASSAGRQTLGARHLVGPSAEQVRDISAFWPTSVGSSLDYFERELGERDFVCGGALTVADVAMHGALTCISPFPIFENVQSRPLLHAWFERVEAMKKSTAEA